MIDLRFLIPGLDPTRLVKGSTCGAIFTDDRLFRFVLWRNLDLFLDRPPIAFLGLNPSTADEMEDDPTIRRCIGFAERWGRGPLIMLNLYAFRATDPKDMWKREAAGTSLDIVGPDHDRHLVTWGAYAGLVIAAWGAFPKARARGAAVVQLLVNAGVEVQVLDFTRDGAPRHPLYAPGRLTPRPYLNTGWGL